MAKVAPGDISEVAPVEEPETLKLIQAPQDGQPPPPEAWESGKSGRESRTSDGRDVTRRTTGLFQFANTEAIKEKVRSQKMQKKAAYDVKDRYHETGIFQKIAKNHHFENITLAVIVVNAIWIWIDTDWNRAETLLDAEAIFVLADGMFFGYFSFELFVRFMAFKRKCDCFKDAWFVFDTTLVTLYAFDPFTIAVIAGVSGGGGLNLPTAVLRLFRLARLSRLVRMLRSLPELMIMIKGMVTAAASVGYTLGLLMVITYVFSIALVNLKTDEGELCGADGPGVNGCLPADGYAEDLESYDEGKNPCTCSAYFFETVLEGMHNLIIYAVFLDNLSDFIIGIKDDSTPCFILAGVYIMISCLTVMNMLIGVLCEVISAVAEEEKESMMVDKVNERFTAIVEKLDRNNDGTLCWDEFQKILEYPEALKALGDVNVDPESMVDMAEDLFFEDGEPVALSFEEFMTMVLDLRGGQQATVKDVMGLGKRFSHKFMTQKVRMDGVEKKMDNVNHKMEALLKHYSLDIPDYHPTKFHQDERKGSSYQNLDMLAKGESDNKLRAAADITK